MKDKWKEKTKLNKKEKLIIISEIISAIVCIAMTIIDKNQLWFLVAELDITIAIQEYCNTKLLKTKEAIIELKDKEIEYKNKLINTLLVRESRK